MATRPTTRTSAASHLGIDLAEYDERIRSFIATYDAMLDIVARTLADAVSKRAPAIVDLGIGTGALAARCLETKPLARIVGIDEDEGMLAAARARLGARSALVHGSFERIELPRCDAIVASLALHHLPTPERRQRMLRRCFRALRPGGVLISADCYPASSPRLRTTHRQAWLRHLEESYTPAAARAYLRAWAKEDVYVPLSDEIAMLERAGFVADVAARRHAFAVVVGMKG